MATATTLATITGAAIAAAALFCGESDPNARFAAVPDTLMNTVVNGEKRDNDDNNGTRRIVRRRQQENNNVNDDPITQPSGKPANNQLENKREDAGILPPPADQIAGLKLGETDFYPLGLTNVDIHNEAIMSNPVTTRQRVDHFHGACLSLKWALLSLEVKGTRALEPGKRSESVARKPSKGIEARISSIRLYNVSLQSSIWKHVAHLPTKHDKGAGKEVKPTVTSLVRKSQTLHALQPAYLQTPWTPFHAALSRPNTPHRSVTITVLTSKPCCSFAYMSLRLAWTQTGVGVDLEHEGSINFNYSPPIEDVDKAWLAAATEAEQIRTTQAEVQKNTPQLMRTKGADAMSTPKTWEDELKKISKHANQAPKMKSSPLNDDAAKGIMLFKALALSKARGIMPKRIHYGVVTETAVSGDASKVNGT